MGEGSRDESLVLRFIAPLGDFGVAARFLFLILVVACGGPTGKRLGDIVSRK